MKIAPRTLVELTLAQVAPMLQVLFVAAVAGQASLFTPSVRKDLRLSKYSIATQAVRERTPVQITTVVSPTGAARAGHGANLCVGVTVGFYIVSIGFCIRFLLKEVVIGATSFYQTQ